MRLLRGPNYKNSLVKLTNGKRTYRALMRLVVVTQRQIGRIKLALVDELNPERRNYLEKRLALSQRFKREWEGKLHGLDRKFKQRLYARIEAVNGAPGRDALCSVADPDDGADGCGGSDVGGKCA